MTTTHYTDFSGPAVNAAWLNDVDALAYQKTFPDGSHPVTLETGGLPAALVPLTDASDYFSTNNTEAALQEVGLNLRKWVTATDPRFGGISGGSWHTAINAAATYAKANGLGLRLLPQSGGYPCTGTVMIPSGLNVDMTGTFIASTVSRPGFGMTVGETTVSNNGVTLLGLHVLAGGTLAWSGTVSGVDTVATNDVGIKLYNLTKSRLDIFRVSGFTVGYELATDSTQGSAYNTITLVEAVDCKYAEVLKSYVASGFPNENKFYGGRRGCSSTANALGDAYGTVLTYDKNVAGAYKSHNNNIWSGPCYEMQTVGTNRIPLWLDGVGNSNRWKEVRHETGTGVLAICDTSSCINNVFEVGFLSGGSTISGISQTNGARDNVYRAFTEYQRTDQTWYSGEIASFLSGRIANVPYIAGPFHFVQNSTTITKVPSAIANFDYGYENGQEYFRGAGTSGIGVFIDTSTTKQFWVSENFISGFPGRLMVQCFDASGAVLSGSAPSYVVGGSLTTTANFGNAYQYGSDTHTNCMLNFDTAVKSARVCFVPGTNVLKLVGFTITAMGTSGHAPLTVYAGPGINDDPALRLSTAKPDTAGEHGRYEKGSAVWNASAAAAAPAGWVVNTAGRLAKTWVTATTYVVGQVRKNGANVYYVTTAGTSGATGPTGTGTAIADGTVVWNFLCPTATFVTMANLA